MAPRLTVVVPLYNVEEYLGACLTSLAEQTMADLEVVLVDDGSTDNGPALAQEFVDRDPRFRLIRQENAGLGAARNAGVRAADPKGEFLTFVDSDDVVPPGAYARMLAELDSSGSDFATGNVLRLRANGALEQSPMFRKPMEKARPATHVTRDWILLGDRIACNKVFRRTFWDEHAFAFPTGVLYEDIAVVLPAHFLARSVDVVEEPVYHWRDRDGSITTRRAVPKGIRDRVTAVTTVSRFLAGRDGMAEAKRRYDAHALSGDLWLFIEALPDGDEEFHTAFLDHAGAFADHGRARCLRRSAAGPAGQVAAHPGAPDRRTPRAARAGEDGPGRLPRTRTPPPPRPPPRPPRPAAARRHRARPRRPPGPRPPHRGRVAGRACCS